MRKGLLLAAAAALAACSGVPHRVTDGRLGDTIDQKAVHGDSIEAIGIGAADPALPTDTQRKATARDAAIVKAQYELLSLVKGVSLNGGVTVQKAMEKDSTLEAKVSDAVRGAEVARSEFTDDGGCVVTLRLPRKRLQRMMGVSFE